VAPPIVEPVFAVFGHVGPGIRIREQLVATFIKRQQFVSALYQGESPVGLCGLLIMVGMMRDRRLAIGALQLLYACILLDGENPVRRCPSRQIAVDSLHEFGVVFQWTAILSLIRS